MAIEIRNVCKSFKDVNAVKNVNLMVESGESVALLGPNGAGKTTPVSYTHLTLPTIYSV